MMMNMQVAVSATPSARSSVSLRPASAASIHSVTNLNHSLSHPSSSISAVTTTSSASSSPIYSSPLSSPVISPIKHSSPLCASSKRPSLSFPLSLLSCLCLFLSLFLSSSSSSVSFLLLPVHAQTFTLNVVLSAGIKGETAETHHHTSHRLLHTSHLIVTLPRMIQHACKPPLCSSLTCSQ